MAASDRMSGAVFLGWREQMSRSFAQRLALYYGAQGDDSRAVPYLRMIEGMTARTTPWLLKLDPWWDKLRGKPAFDAAGQERIPDGAEVRPGRMKPGDTLIRRE
jgi:hypothetical protein